MAQNKYKRHSRGGRFKQQGDGLRASVDEIRRQRQTEIDALKTQALQQKERDSLQISGLRNVAKSEAENRNVLQDLENKIYQNKRNAISVRADREVDALLGEAEELGKESEFWQDFATKYSAELGDAASGIANYAQYRAAINAYEKQTKDQKDIAEALHESSYQIIKKEGDEAVIQIDDLRSKKDTVKSIGWFANNAFYQKMIVNDLMEKIPSYVDAARGWTTDDGKVLYDKNTAGQILLNIGYNLASKYDIPLNSEAGRKLISKMKQLSVIETHSLIKGDKFKTDAEDLRGQAKLVDTLLRNIDDPGYYIDKGKKVFVDKLVQGGYEYVGPFKVASGEERFNDAVNDLYIMYKGSYVKGSDNSIVAPGHPSRQSETPKHTHAAVLKIIGDNVNFQSKADKLTYLNVPVRDKNGRIVYKKDGITPAERLLDKLPELKIALGQQWDTKNSKVTSAKELKQNTEIKGKFAIFNAEITKSATEDIPYSSTLLNPEYMSKVNATAYKHRTHEAAKPFMDMLGVDDLLTGDKKKDLKIISSAYLILQDYSTGDIEGARFQYIKMNEIVDGLTPLFKSMAAAHAYPDFRNELNKFIEGKFLSGIDQNSFINKTVANQDDLNTMIDRGVGRFMAVWAELDDITDVRERFKETKKIVGDEIDLGLEKQQGMFAATEVKPGNLRLGWTFNALEDGKNTPQALNKKTATKFYTEKEFATTEFVTSNKSKDQTQTENHVNKILVQNFKQLVTLDDARNLLGELSTGTIDNNIDIPDNLKIFISTTKSLGYQVTTRDVMTMVINHIRENGDTLFKDKQIDTQFGGFGDQTWLQVEWPVGLDDFVKSTTENKIAPKNHKDGYASVLKEYFENTLGLNFNQHLIQLYKSKSRRIN